MIQGEHVLPDEEKAETFVDLGEAEEKPVVQRPDEEPPVIKKPDLQEDETLAPIIEIPVEPSETETPVPRSLPRSGHAVDEEKCPRGTPAVA